MPEIEEKGSAGGPEPTSDQAVSGNVDEGTVEDDEGADSSSPKSPRLSTSPVPVPGSETNVTPDDPAHEAGVNEQEKQQDSSSAVKVDNSKDSLEDFDWDDLEQRFCTAMEKFQKIEDEIGEEYRQWLQVRFLASLFQGNSLKSYRYSKHGRR